MGNPKQAAVLGFPVRHSLSPRLHTYWLRLLGMPGQYTAIEVKPEALEETLKSLQQKGYAGVNLTIPHKEAVIPLLDEVDPLAQSIGAVNTVTFAGKKRIGSNSDSYGFRENIAPALAAKNKAVILGAGGAARSVVRSLLDLDFKEIVIANRTLPKAEQLSGQFAGKPQAAEWKDRHGLLTGADLLVNTTSLGLEGNEPLELELEALPREAVVTDIVYVPLMTPLLEKARARGHTVVDGLGMLLHQAVPAFEAFFGRRPKVTSELRRHLLEG